MKYLPTLLHIHDPDGIGAEVLVLAGVAVVLHLQDEKTKYSLICLQ